MRERGKLGSVDVTIVNSTFLRLPAATAISVHYPAVTTFLSLFPFSVCIVYIPAIPLWPLN